MIEIKARTKHPSPLAGNAHSSRPIVESTDSLEQIELVSTKGPSSHTASHIMGLDCAPPSDRLADPLCVRLHDLCNHDFRAESWYRSNLFLVMFFVIGLACIALPAIALEFLLYIFMLMSIHPIFIPIFLICVTTIPLCGIVHMMQQSGPFKRRSGFILRLAVDSAKAYRVSRGLFFALAPLSAAVFIPLLYWDYAKSAAIVPGSWCAVCALISYDSGSCLWSIYSELFSSPGYSGQCDYQAASAT